MRSYFISSVGTCSSLVLSCPASSSALSSAM
jgi:hypothetical protein